MKKNNNTQHVIVQLFNQQGLVVLVALFLLSAVLVSSFFSKDNLINVVRQGSLIFAYASAMSLAMLIGGLDLSVGSVGALAGAAAATQIVLGNHVAGVIFGIGVGVLCGLFSGFIIGTLKVPHFIMTYGMMQIARGLTLMVTGGKNIYGFADSFRVIGVGTIGVIPVPVFIVTALMLVLVFLTTRTVYGRALYAVGSNQTSAKFSGIQVKRHVLITYAVCGGLSAFAGIIYIARMGSAEPIMGEDWALTAIAASVIGGTTFRGGEGAILQTFFGALSIAIIYNILSLLNVTSSWQQFAIGSIIIVSILFNKFKSKVMDRLVANA
jgi:ribose/xylose/arabinose/galactoside ABC-type transport system permease subunit